MKSYSLTHVPDAVLVENLAHHYAEENDARAVVLAHIAEIDERKLYVPAGYPSMYAYCVDVLGMTRNKATKRIQAARCARQFPAIFAMVAEDTLSFSGICLLAQHLNGDNETELLTAVSGKTKFEIESWLRQRFSQFDSLPLAPGTEESGSLEKMAPSSSGDVLCSPGSIEMESVASSPPLMEQGSSAPPAAQREDDQDSRTIRIVFNADMQRDLHYIQALLGCRNSAGEQRVVGRALRMMAREIERRVLGPRRPESANPRRIRQDVKSTVWLRDHGQCTFVSEVGHRCSSRHFLEYDHIVPVARGGLATVENLRLRCRAHNQLEAERTFGMGFMEAKREAARVNASRGAARAEQNNQRTGEANTDATPASTGINGSPDRAIADIISGLRNLGFRKEDARSAAEFAHQHLPDAPIERRFRLALSSLAKNRPTDLETLLKKAG